MSITPLPISFCEGRPYLNTILSHSLSEPIFLPNHLHLQSPLKNWKLGINPKKVLKPYFKSIPRVNEKSQPHSILKKRKVYTEKNSVNISMERDESLLTTRRPRKLEKLNFGIKEKLEFDNTELLREILKIRYNKISKVLNKYKIFPISTRQRLLKKNNLQMKQHERKLDRLISEMKKLRDEKRNI